MVRKTGQIFYWCFFRVGFVFAVLLTFCSPKYSLADNSSLDDSNSLDSSSQLISIRPLHFIPRRINLAKSPSSTESASTESRTISSKPLPASSFTNSVLKGWDYLFELLVDYGIDPTIAAQILADKRMPAKQILYFSLEPKEKRALYSKHNTKSNRQHALSFYRLHQDTFRYAEEKYDVPEFVILALLQIETACGENMGNNLVFYRLARLASASAPDNLAANFSRKLIKSPTLSFEQVADRGIFLQQTFLEHTAATVDLAQQIGIHPLEIKGSTSGAIGIPQFLPGNIVKYGFDADNNGRVDIFNPKDAILSVAQFLQKNGWRGQNLQNNENKNALRSYNNSLPYITTVLTMAAALRHDVAFNKPISSN